MLGNCHDFCYHIEANLGKCPMTFAVTVGASAITVGVDLGHIRMTFGIDLGHCSVTFGNILSPAFKLGCGGVDLQASL